MELARLYASDARDHEGDDCEVEHGGDEELSLGNTNATINQDTWASGYSGDLEQGTTRRFWKPETVS